MKVLTPSLAPVNPARVAKAARLTAVSQLAMTVKLAMAAMAWAHRAEGATVRQLEEEATPATTP